MAVGQLEYIIRCTFNADDSVSASHGFYKRLAQNHLVWTTLREVQHFHVAHPWRDCAQVQRLRLNLQNVNAVSTINAVEHIKHNLVTACTCINAVNASSTVNHVGSCARHDGVVACSAVNRVGTAYRVVRHICDDDVRSAAAHHRVITFASADVLNAHQGVITQQLTRLGASLCVAFWQDDC